MRPARDHRGPLGGGALRAAEWPPLAGVWRPRSAGGGARARAKPKRVAGWRTRLCASTAKSHKS